MVTPIAMREIIYEPMFDENSFVGKPFCDEALRIIRGSDLMIFTTLPTVVYPQLVRDFYMRFKVGTDERGVMRVYVEIDGEQYSFGRKELATALNIRRYKVVAHKEQPEEMKDALTKRNGGNKGLRTSSLDENQWLVDKFLRTYVCPFAHFNEVPKYGYQFWYSLLTKGSIDVPLLVIEMMSKSLKRGKKNEPHGLILPRMITTILRAIGCNVNPRTESVSSFEVFSYQTVKKSLEALGRQAGLIEPKKKATRASTSGRQGDEEEENEGEGNEAEGNEEEEDEEEGARPGFEYGGASNPPDSGTQGDWGGFTTTHGQSQNPWGAYDSTQRDWMQGVNTQLQGMGTMMESMHATVQRLDTTVQGMDTRVNMLETRVGGIQETLDDYAFEQHELYAMQRLSMTHTYGEQRANEMFTEANAHAESAQPRRRGRRRRNPAAHDDQPME